MNGLLRGVVQTRRYGVRLEKGVGETASHRKTRGKGGETIGAAHEAQRECEQERRARSVAIAVRSSKISRVDLGRRQGTRGKLANS